MADDLSEVHDPLMSRRIGTRLLAGWIATIALIGGSAAASHDRSAEAAVRADIDRAPEVTTSTTTTTSSTVPETIPTTTEATTTTTTTTTAPPVTAPPTTVPPPTTAPPAPTTTVPSAPSFSATAANKGTWGYDLVGSGCPGQALVHSTLFPGASDGAFPLPDQPGTFAYFIGAPATGTFDVWVTCHAVASDGTFDPAVILVEYARQTLPGLPG